MYEKCYGNSYVYAHNELNETSSTFQDKPIQEMVGNDNRHVTVIGEFLGGNNIKAISIGRSYYYFRNL
jgi:hypothetical protein